MRPRPSASLLVVGAALLVASAPARPARADARRPLTLSEAIDLALRRSPDMQMAHEEIVAAEAGRKAMRGNLGPKLRLEANVIRWDTALDITFDMPGLPLEIPPTRARDATTKALTATLAFPLGNLWTIYEGYKIKEIGVDVAKVQREATRRALAYQVTEAFFRVLQAQRLAEVAQLSVEQLQAQVQRARSFFKHGLVGQNDLLRAELGLAAARQRAIQARGNVDLAQSKLAYTIGLSPDVAVQPVVPASIETGPPPPLGLSLVAAEQRALTSRVELTELEARLAQAGHGVRASWSKLLPSVNLVASYQLNYGSVFTQEKAYFVGVTASWDVWEWGATYYGIPEAKANLRKALAGREKLRDGIRLETRAAHVQAATAAEAVAVARQAVAQAEENFRLESRRYESRVNTSFDVLDAETQLTQARANLQTATFEYLIARAALAKAMGEGPLALAATTESAAPATTAPAAPTTTAPAAPTTNAPAAPTTNAPAAPAPEGTHAAP